MASISDQESSWKVLAKHLESICNGICNGTYRQSMQSMQSMGICRLCSTQCTQCSQCSSLSDTKQSNKHKQLMLFRQRQSQITRCNSSFKWSLNLQQNLVTVKTSDLLNSTIAISNQIIVSITETMTTTRVTWIRFAVSDVCLICSHSEVSQRVDALSVVTQQ